MWLTAFRLYDSSGLHVNGQRERERQRSVGEEIVHRHSTLLGCRVWGTFVETKDLRVNKGSLDEVELTDHGSIFESRS